MPRKNAKQPETNVAETPAVEKAPTTPPPDAPSPVDESPGRTLRPGEPGFDYIGSAATPQYKTQEDLEKAGLVPSGPAVSPPSEK